VSGQIKISHNIKISHDVFTNLSTKINQAEVCYTQYVEEKNIISVQVFMRHEAGSAQRQH